MAIAKQFNKQQVPSFSGNGWSQTSVAKLLVNRQVLGEHQPRRMENGKRVADGELLKDYFPRVVSDELFYRVQSGLKARLTHSRGRKGATFNNLFSSIAFCAYCNSKMRYQDTGKGKIYLVCDGAKRGMGCTVNTGWRYDEFEKAFLAFVDELDLASVINHDSQNNARVLLQNEIEAANGKLKELTRLREKTYELLAKMSSDFVAKKLNDLEQELKATTSLLQQKEQELSALSTIKADVDELKSNIGKVTGGDYALRALVSSQIKNLIDEVIIAPVGATMPLYSEPGTEPFDVAAVDSDDPRRDNRWFLVAFKNRDYREVVIVPSDAPNKIEALVSKTEFPKDDDDD
jgi:hypothetical protein